jgi:hypothetical protein
MAKKCKKGYKPKGDECVRTKRSKTRRYSLNYKKIYKKKK